MMLKAKELWYEEAQWLLHPRILEYIEQLMRRQASIDWHGLYSIPEPISPTFFMEGYTGPSPPIPPSHSHQVPTVPLITQSAPPTLPPRDRSVEPMQEPPVRSKPVSVDPPAPVLEQTVLVSVKPPAPVSVSNPILVEPSAPVSDPPAPVSVEPPVPVSGSKPKTKPRKKKTKAGPSNQSGSNQPTLAPQAPSKGKKRAGESMEAGPKKTRIVSAEFISTSDGSDEETEPKAKVDEKAAKPKKKSQVFVDIATKPPSHLRTPADEQMEPKPKSKPRPRARSRQIEPTPKAESGEEILHKPKSKSQPVPRRVNPETTEKRRSQQNAAIEEGKFRLADKSCDTCT
jgi:hypothetical protein